MTTLQKALLAVAVLCLMIAAACHLGPGLLETSATPFEIIIVERDSELSKLPQAQLALLGSPAVRKAAADAGILFERTDVDDTGPDLPKWAIAAAAGHPLPAWVTRDKQGRVAVKPLPKDEQAGIGELK
jgi:hypothetical protein